MQIQKLISSRRWSYSRNGFAVLMLAFMPHVQLVDCTLGGSPGLLPWILSGSLEAEYAVQQDDEDKEDEGNMADQENQESQDTEKKRVITEPSKEVWLPSLKQVRLRHGDAVENTTAMTQLEAILLHPHLESLFLLGVDWTGDEARRMQWNDRISNLTFLELKESIVDASGLQHILTRCKNILNLTIQLGDARREGWDREEDSWQVDLDQFSRVLRKHGRGLTQLDLHTVEYQASNGSEGRLGSLRELSSLKHLGVTKVDLLGTPYERASQVGPEDLSLQSALPQSLETLHLHFDDYYYAGQSLDEAGHQELYELITGGQFPNLYEVKVEFYLTDPSRLFGREIVGWEIHTVEEHLWERAASSGCLRSILVFSRIG
ncbi:hypothetical protein QQX98_008948 [Neonectria punicea]|uniref:Leucine-rich repeat domain-containing protein n=1 Tax=Neonectria punicea TaxID=979145 RepID=A0ABR1GTP8_9HYPO